MTADLSDIEMAESKEYRQADCSEVELVALLVQMLGHSLVAELVEFLA